MNNLGIIKRLSLNIVFVFDSDKAGFAAALRAAATALSLDMNVKGADTGEGLDPADLVLEKGIPAWKEVIRNSKHIIEFLLDKFLFSTSLKDPLKTKLEVEQKIIPFLSYISNPVKRSHFISIISEKSGIREEDIRQNFEKKMKEKIREEGKEEEKKTPDKQNIFRKDYILRRLLGIILWQRQVKNPVVKAEESLEKIGEILGISTEEALSSVKEIAPELIFEAEVFYGNEVDVKKDLLELLSNLEEEYLKIGLLDGMRELQSAENSGDEFKSSLILKKINDINNRIQNIKSERVKK